MFSFFRKSIFALVEGWVRPRLYPSSVHSAYLEAVFRNAGFKAALVPLLLFLAFAFGSLLRYGRPLSRLSEEKFRAYYGTLLVSRWYLLRMSAYALKSHALIAAGMGPHADERAVLRLSQERTIHEV